MTYPKEGARREGDEVTAAINRAVDGIPDQRDPLRTAAARRVLAKIEWQSGAARDPHPIVNIF